jgi:IclR family pca regulon transcriptional regulator
MNRRHRPSYGVAESPFLQSIVSHGRSAYEGLQMNDELDGAPVPEIETDDDAIDPRYIVPGLSRGLAMLQIFTRQSPAHTLAELAASVELSRSAAYRLAYTLEKDGFIAREKLTRRYRLTSKVLSLGFEYFNSQTITDLAQPYLQRVSEACAASSYLVILDGCHAVYLARGAPTAALVSNLQVGSRQPAHMTASGRIMMAYLPEQKLRDIAAQLAREYRKLDTPSAADLIAQAKIDAARGYVFHPSLLAPGITSCAGPVRKSRTQPVAAITVIGPTRHMEVLGGEAALANIVSAATTELSREVGFTG